MKFKITNKTIVNEIRNYLALGFQFLGIVLHVPTAICNSVYNWLKVDE